MQVSEQAPARSHAQTREQARAKLAWAWVIEAGKLEKAHAARYGTLTKKLPSYLYTSGFEQTMAFLFSKADKSDRKPEGLLFAQLARHTLGLLRPTGAPLLPDRANLSQMMDAIVKLDVNESRQASHEATCIAQWLHRFGAAELGEEE